MQVRENKENKGIDSVDQPMQGATATEEVMGIEELKMVSKLTEQRMDLNAVPLSEELIDSSDKNAIVPEVAKEDHVIILPHINLVLGDRLLELEDHVHMTQIQDLQHQFIRALFQSKSEHQKM